MRLNEYHKLAMRTSPDGHDRVKNGCMGLIGESGELMDVLKKHMFQSGENPVFPRDKMLEELGDVLWYQSELSAGLGVDISYFNLTDHPTPDTSTKGFDDMVYLITVCACDLYRFLIVFDEYSDSDKIMPKRVEMHMQWILDTVRRIASRLGHTLSDVMECNIKKLQARYPDGFDPEKSIHREHERLPWEEA